MLTRNYLKVSEVPLRIARQRKKNAKDIYGQRSKITLRGLNPKIINVEYLS